MDPIVAATTMPVAKCPVSKNLCVLCKSTTRTTGTKSNIKTVTTAGRAALVNPVVAIRQTKDNETAVKTAPKATAITTIHLPREVR